METAATLVAEGAAALARGGVAAPQPDAELLLAHVLGVERASLHAFPAEEIPDRAIASYRALLARRAAREPLQYITGIQEFWSLEFRVTPAVLIPRPETELLLESLLRLNRRPDPSIVDTRPPDREQDRVTIWQNARPPVREFAGGRRSERDRSASSC